MTEEGEEADFLSSGHKHSRRERFRDRLLKKTDKLREKDVQRDEDIDDFLLKSPQDGDALPRFASPLRKPVPRINVAASPRWPEAQEITAKEGTVRLVENRKEALPYFPTKPRRKKGLTVRFAEIAPQIIGEGGDEAEAPTVLISRTSQSGSAHSFAHDGYPQIYGTSATTDANPTASASNIADPAFRPRILVRAPTGLRDEERGPDAVALVNGMKETEFELSVASKDMTQNAVKSHSDSLTSSSKGLNRQMLEEEARVFISDRRDSSPEPALQRQIVTPPINSQESLPSALMASYVQRGYSPRTASSLLSPEGQSPRPSRPSSSSSNGSMAARSSSRQSLDLGQGPNHTAPPVTMVPKRKPLLTSPGIGTQEDALPEFRLRARRYYSLFILAVETTKPGMDAPLSRWVRAAAWWFLAAETNFKLLRKDLEDGVNILQITTSRRHTQAIVDLAKTAWIIEDIVQQYAKAESIDISSPESIERLIRGNTVPRLSRSLQYWQDLSKRFVSLVAAIRRNGFMTSTSDPLFPGIDSIIWLPHHDLAPNVSSLLRLANPSWIKMDDTVTPVEPLDLAEVIPLKSTADTFRMRSIFCQTSGGFPHQSQTPNVPCILTIARRRGSYALVLFVASQDHGINVAIETDPVRGDRIEWQPTTFGALCKFADGFQFLIQLLQADYMHLKECYDLARRVSTATAQDVLTHAKFSESLIFRATAKMFERKSLEKVKSFPYEGKQRDCDILLIEKFEFLRGKSNSRKIHRGFRLSVVFSPHAANLGILDVAIGGDKPILLQSSNEHTPLLIELMEHRGASLLIQFAQNKDFNRFYELLTSLDYFARGNDGFGNISIRSFSIEPSSSEATTFLSGAPWKNVQITTGNGQSHQSNYTANMVDSASISIRIFSAHCVFADRLSQGVCACLAKVMSFNSLTAYIGRSEVYLGLTTAEPTSICLWRAAQQDMNVVVSFKTAPTNAATVAEQLLAQSRTAPTVWKYTFATPQDLHVFQKCLTGADVLFDGTASSFLVSRGHGLRTKKEDLGTARLQLLQDPPAQSWQVLAYFDDGSPALNFALDANGVFEQSNTKARFGIRLLEANVSFPAAAESDDINNGKKSRFICVDDVAVADDRVDIVISFDDEPSRDRLAQLLPSPVKKASSLMGALHLR